MIAEAAHAFDAVPCPHRFTNGQLRRLDDTHFERWLVCSECLGPVRQLDAIIRTRDAQGQDCFTEL